jgi:hypothetical protein
MPREVAKVYISYKKIDIKLPRFGLYFLTLATPQEFIDRGLFF